MMDMDMPFTALPSQTAFHSNFHSAALSQHTCQSSPPASKRTRSAPPSPPCPFSSPIVALTKRSKTLHVPLPINKHCRHPLSAQAQPISSQSASTSDDLTLLSKPPWRTEATVSRPSTLQACQGSPAAQLDQPSPVLPSHRALESDKTDAQQLQAQSQISSIYQPPPSRKKQLSYPKQRTRQNIKIINATFAVCQESATQGATRFEANSSQAYPVYQVGKGQFLVPATKSDYRVLRKLQDRTRARVATLRFIESSRVPGRSRRISCISLRMPDILNDSLKNVDTEILRILKSQGWTYNGEPLTIGQTGSQGKLSTHIYLDSTS